jgi:alpha-1,3/alpha-1,6-mannosyltransferase
MYCSRVCIACNSGGPLESIIDGKTGYLCPPTIESFSNAMLTIVNNLSKTSTMGESGHEHVSTLFSLKTFTSTLDSVIRQQHETNISKQTRTQVLKHTLLLLFVSCMLMMVWSKI